MIINIFFISSYSSQLGSLLALVNHHRLKSTLKEKHIFILFQLPTLSDKKCKFSPFEKNILKNYFINFNLFKFKVNNNFKRLILWILLLLTFPLFWNNNLIIWQARPDWIKNCFSFKNFMLPVILPKKNLYYCGDGFLSLCRSSIPFWLKPKGSAKQKDGFLDKNEKNTFYYLYSIDCHKPSKYDIKIPREFVREVISEIIESKKNKKYFLIKRKELTNTRKSLLIFPTSTFYETKRCSLKEEINLYLEFINKKINVNSHFICVKPHPGSSKIKTLTLEKKLLESGYELFRWQDYLNLGEVYKTPLEVIPLELFISILVKQLGIKYEKLDLTVSSNASLSCLILYPKLNYLNAFSSKLIKKYINDKFANQRLEQEDFIKKFIINNINSN